MSSFVVDRHHIACLVQVARAARLRYWIDRDTLRPDGTYGPDGTVSVDNRDEATAAGAMLTASIVRGVSDRYPADAIDELPGAVSHWWTDGYGQHRDVELRTAVELLKALAGYEYQASDAHNWEHSEARAFCDALRLELIHRLPGYGDAPWTIDEPAPRRASWVMYP